MSFSSYSLRKRVLCAHSVMSNSLRPACQVPHGILQVRILEWVAISPSGDSSQPDLEIEPPPPCIAG